jgi:hypothetical protein
VVNVTLTKLFCAIYFLAVFLSALEVLVFGEGKDVPAQKRAEEAVKVMQEAANLELKFNVVVAPTLPRVHFFRDKESGEIYIVVDSDFIEKVNQDELLFLMGHEMSHVTLDHRSQPDKPFATKEAEADFNSWKLMKEKLGKDFDAVAFVRKFLPEERARIGELEALIAAYVKDNMVR